MTFFYVKQVPMLKPDLLRQHSEFLVPRVLELCYTAWDMSGFATSLGWDGPPFRWDSVRRALIRAEIDALMFRLYGVARSDSDVNYIMDTFEALRKNEKKRWGDYRTKQLILERYDAMVEADNRGQPYQTILDPPPETRQARGGATG